MSKTQKFNEISPEQAEKEVLAWLDFKGVRKGKRKTFAAAIANITEAVEEGILVIDPESKVVTQYITIPVLDSEITEMKHEPRIIAGKIHSAMKGIDVQDGNERLKSLVKVSTGQNNNILIRMDSTDYNLAADIIVFFLT